MDRNMQHNHNAVLDAVFDYAATLANHKIANPMAADSDPYGLQLQQGYYQTLVQTYSQTTNPAEKKTLAFLKLEISRLQTKLQPGFRLRILHGIRRLFAGNRTLFANYRQYISQIGKQVMDQHNLHTLMEATKQAGFKFQMEGQLKKMIEQQIPAFHLPYADAAHKNTHFMLHFEKIPGSRLYYFKKFDAATSPTVADMLQGKNSVTRMTFPQHTGIDFTSQQAASLLQGKAVYKVVEGTGTWLYYDPAKMGQEFPFTQVRFNLQSAVAALPLLHGENASLLPKLTEALQNGSSKTVPLHINGKTDKYTVTAMPKQGKLFVTDREGRPVQLPGPRKPDPALGKAQQVHAAVQNTHTKAQAVTIKPG